MTADNNPALVHCIYSSTAIEAFSEQDILQLLDCARQNNAGLDVTGMLLYDKGAFFQVLEGDHDVVTALLRKIKFDKRHDKVTKIIFEAIEQRSFADWTMGYSGISREKLQEIDGLNEFFKTNKVFTDLDEGRAKTLLQAFKGGKWRSSLI